MDDKLRLLIEEHGGYVVSVSAMPSPPQKK